MVVHREGVVLDAGEGAIGRGVKVGQALSEAKAVLRDDGAYVLYREEEFLAARDAWLDVCAAFSDVIEPVTPHEAFIDLTGHPEPRETGEALLGHLQGELTAGLAPGKWVARLAARGIDRDALQAGLPVIEQVRDVPAFLSDVPTAYLLPVPPEHRQRLEFLGYRWVREVATAGIGVLSAQFGRDAFLIHEAARGRALDAVVPGYPREAVSARVAFDCPLTDRLQLEEAVNRVCAELSSELCSRDATAEELAVFFEPENGPPIVSRRKLGKPVQAATPLRVAVHALWSNVPLASPPVAVKVLLSGLKKAPRGQVSLHGLAGKEERSRSCDVSVRCLRAAFGEETVKKAVELKVPRRELVLRVWKRATGWR